MKHWVERVEGLPALDWQPGHDEKYKDARTVKIIKLVITLLESIVIKIMTLGRYTFVTGTQKVT